jgi:SAM-dependent methyltransferase
MAGSVKRGPFQGVWTIIRFNWHLHVMALAAITVLVTAALSLTGHAALLFAALAVAVMLSVFISLLASWHAYDASELYDTTWLAPEMEQARRAANFHAGFDETTSLLKSAFPSAEWLVFDFYDPKKHTEISIRRARRVHPPSSQTLAIHTDHIPLANASLDRALLILAAHEIRDPAERAGFFRELQRVLAPGGRVIVTEHLRDPANIIAYTIGAWHFHTRSQWLATFQAAGFRVARQFRNNLLITTFILEPNATAH